MAANAADARQVSRKRDRAKADEAIAGVVVRALMSTVDGRRYIWLRLSSMHIFSSTFTTNALTSAFQEGERNVGLQLYAEVTRFAPQAVFQMMVENSAVELKEQGNGRNTSEFDTSSESDGRSDTYASVDDARNASGA